MKESRPRAPPPRRARAAAGRPTADRLPRPVGERVPARCRRGAGGEPGAGEQKQAQKDPSQQHSDPDLASHDAQHDAAAQQKTDGAQEEEPKDKKKTISRVPDSALNESQTYDRWKVLSGIKKKVI